MTHRASAGLFCIYRWTISLDDDDDDDDDIDHRSIHSVGALSLALTVHLNSLKPLSAPLRRPYIS